MGKNNETNASQHCKNNSHLFLRPKHGELSKYFGLKGHQSICKFFLRISWRFKTHRNVKSFHN